MITPVVVLLLAAAPTAPRLAEPTFQGVDIAPEKLAFYSDFFAQRLSRHGIKVVTQTELRDLLSLERQRQLLGCTEGAASCMGELANALGADGVIHGAIGRFGSQLQIALKITSSAGKGLSLYDASARDDRAVLERLDEAASQMAPEVLVALNRMPAPDVRRPRTAEWVLGIAGGAAVAGGITLLALAWSWDSALVSNASVPLSTATSYRNNGPFAQTAGIALTAAGAVALGATAWLHWWRPDPKISATIALEPRGGALVVSGSLP